MKPQELLGKQALRTRPIWRNENYCDRAYVTEPCLILVATETHVVVQTEKDPILRHFGEDKGPNTEILGPEFVDDNWIPYDDLWDQVLAVQSLMKHEADEIKRVNELNQD